MEALIAKLSPELQAEIYKACPPSTKATMDNYSRAYGVQGAATGAFVLGMAGVALCTATAPACLVAGIVGGSVLGGASGYETGQILGYSQAKQGNWESDQVCVADTVARLKKRPVPAPTR